MLQNTAPLRKVQEKLDFNELSKLIPLTKETLHREKDNCLVATRDKKIVGVFFYKPDNNSYSVETHKVLKIYAETVYTNMISYLKNKLNSSVSKNEIIFIVPDDNDIEYILPILTSNKFSIKLKSNQTFKDNWICTWRKND